MSHEEKHSRQIEEKHYIAQKAAELVEEGDTIFLGPGTTVELLAEEINKTTLQVITNCLPVFQILSQKQSETFRSPFIGRRNEKYHSVFYWRNNKYRFKKMHFLKCFSAAMVSKEMK